MFRDHRTFNLLRRDKIYNYIYNESVSKRSRRIRILEVSGSKPEGKWPL
jgi:hypothetical protein